MIWCGMIPGTYWLCFRENYKKNKPAIQNKPCAVEVGIERNNLIILAFVFGTQM